MMVCKIRLLAAFYKDDMSCFRVIKNTEEYVSSHLQMCNNVNDVYIATKNKQK